MELLWTIREFSWKTFFKGSPNFKWNGSFTIGLMWTQDHLAQYRLKCPCWWLQLWLSSLNLPLVCFLNLLGVKVLILLLQKVYQAWIRKFLWKATAMKRDDFLWPKRYIIELLWTLNHFIHVSQILSNKCYIDKVYPKYWS